MHPLTYADRVRASDLPQTRRAVALALAARARNRDGHCWPSVTRICADAGLSRATVYRALADLEAAGWVVRIRRYAGARQSSNAYVLTVPDDAAPVENPRPGPVDNRGGGVSLCDPPRLTVRPPGGLTVRPRTRSNRTGGPGTAAAVDIGPGPAAALVADLARSAAMP